MGGIQKIKDWLTKRLILREVQLMRAEENELNAASIAYLHAGVKELRYIYRQLFAEDFKDGKDER